LLLQVHDELVFETPLDALKEDAALIEQEMVHAMDLRVPLKVDIGSGKNWQEGK
jgi:DNA polymerase-1